MSWRPIIYRQERPFFATAKSTRDNLHKLQLRSIKQHLSPRHAKLNRYRLPSVVNSLKLTAAACLCPNSIDSICQVLVQQIHNKSTSNRTNGVRSIIVQGVQAAGITRESIALASMARDDSPASSTASSTAPASSTDRQTDWHHGISATSRAKNRTHWQCRPTSVVYFDIGIPQLTPSW